VRNRTLLSVGLSRGLGTRSNSAAGKNSRSCREYEYMLSHLDLPWMGPTIEEYSSNSAEPELILHTADFAVVGIVAKAFRVGRVRIGLIWRGWSCGMRLFIPIVSVALAIALAGVVWPLEEKKPRRGARDFQA
jgi:hypothetical protein